MSRGYGKYRRGVGSQASFHFDNLFKENTNKPSAARSAATVGKWGITSFTSIRQLNGLPRQDSTEKPSSEGDTNISSVATTPATSTAPKPKKFFKSRGGTDATTPTNCEPTDTATAAALSAHPHPSPVARRTKRYKDDSDDDDDDDINDADYVVAGGSGRTTRAKSQPSKSPLRPASVRLRSDSITKNPPIVLRICRGKSQLLNDSDESESANTPATSQPTTPTSTSPRTQSQKIPPNCRITRSARRSMQRDSVGDSPASTDTPMEFSLFTSPSNHHGIDDLTSPPHYIPPDKYELERRALYDNLLNPGKNSQSSTNDGSSLQHDAAFSEDHCSREDDEEQTSSEQLKRVESTDASSNSKQGPGAAIEREWESSDSESHDDPSSRGGPQANDDCLSDKQITNKKAEADVYITQEEGLTSTTITTTTSSLASEELESRVVSCESEEPTPAVKLVISKKKGSIFKSRTAGASDGTKRRQRALYRHQWTDESHRSGPRGEHQDSTTLELDVSDMENGSTRLDRACNTQSLDTSSDSDVAQHAASLSGPSDAGGNGSAFSSDPLRRVKRPLTSGAGSSAGSDNSAVSQFGAMNMGGQGDLESKTGGLAQYDDDDDSNIVTSLKCPRSDKGYYTVVRNVKKAHQIQEIGEFQELNDDVEYILDALQDNNPISTRCLSAITLATKCMAPAFRMHVRAHGTVAKFFKALHDATKDQCLGLCTATVMFVLSQDRLNMDLDRDCLELMLNLLESDVNYQQALDVSGLTSAQLEKNKQKVRELCAEIQSHGHAMHLNLNNITVGQLAMETLLSLTSKRAGEWFKEELRELGGLEHIMKTILECCVHISNYMQSWTDNLLHKLRKVDRCLRVLENVTHNNEDNQTYLLRYDNGILLDTLVKLYKLCDSEIPLHPVTDISDKESIGAIIRELLLVILKVLINLTHHFGNQSIGSSLIGTRPGIVETSLHLLLQIPNFIPDQKKFELGVLVLMLLINLIQDNEFNKKILMEAKAPTKFENIYSREETAVEALIAQFYDWESCAKIAEKRTNAILDGEKDDTSPSTPTSKSNEEFIEETVAKLLQKAGTHMEFTFLASYIVMLTGFLIMDNKEYQENVRQYLRGNDFVDMVDLLKKFFNFMNLTSSTEPSNVCAIKTTEKVIRFLEDCDKPQNTEQGKAYSECMDLSYTMAH